MELDVREIAPARKHSTIFETFEALEVDDCFVLINDHDPVPLWHQFNANFSRSFEWQYLLAGPEEWQIQITRTASTPLPRILANTSDLATSEARPDLTGAIWKLSDAQRDLDTHVIAIDPGTAIASHAGPDRDILFMVIDGDGAIGTELDEVPVRTGDLVWLPRRSERRILAGPNGLRYLTVHTRQVGLGITSV